jgi:hypothetical protein
MSISEHFQYRNDVFQSDIFVSNIEITDVDVGCRISPTLGSMSMPTYICMKLTMLTMQGKGTSHPNRKAPMEYNKNLVSRR